MIVRLLVLRGRRRIEIGGMRCSEFSDDAKMWTLPKERSKNKHGHRLPVTGLTAEIMRQGRMYSVATACLAPEQHRASLSGSLAKPCSTGT
jgi:hypothetical protein